MPTPIHWFRLNETTGAVAADAIGSASGAYVGTPTLGQGVAPSTNPDVLSVLLSGDDYVDVLSSSTASGVQMPIDNTTMMVWFKPPSDSSAPTDYFGVVLFATDGTAIVELFYEHKAADPYAIGGPQPEVKRFTTWISADSLVGDQLIYDLPLIDNDNDWYHVALTWGDGTPKLYVYGPIDTGPSTQVREALQSYVWPSGNATTIRSGQDTYLISSRWLRGHLCDIKLYDSVLPLADIESERDRRDYSTPTVPTISSGEVREGLANAVQGAVGTYQHINWTKSGLPVDLTGATLTGFIRPRFDAARDITGTLVIDDDPTTGGFLWMYSGSDVEHAGTFQVQFVATYDGHIEITKMSEWTVYRKL